ncbi:MAG: polyhydroxyalkanoate synthesis regulator DNA-binding domain-containing protein [Deltaproteobacteria bacterium]|nr:polyhydroxyalkanoate synthesis regulator DNA-binding domain-containing protein [Deltaproteobacteria bacterium]
MPEDRLLVKKYSNRRLYDTEKSAYVTLDDICQAIKQGRQVDVVDAKTREDVTAFILTQIVLEEARKKNILLPVPLLHLVIQHGESVLAEFFDKYLHQTIRSYLMFKTTLDEQFRKWLDMGADLTSLAQKTMVGLSPLKSVFDAFGDKSKPGEEKKKE